MNAIRYTQKYTAVVVFKIQHSDAQWAQILLSLSSKERKENETFSGGFQTLWVSSTFYGLVLVSQH